MSTNRTASETTTWVVIEPHDTVHVRDGRQFSSRDSATALAESVAPRPSTIAGALASAYGGDLTAVRGPVLGKQDADGVWRPYFPVPADVVADVTANAKKQESDRKAHRLAVGSTVHGTDLAEAEGAPERLLELSQQTAAKVEPVQGWMRGRSLESYLNGTLFRDHAAPLSHLGLADGEPLVPEHRIGIALQDRRVRPGYLYHATHLRPREGWAFLAEVAPHPERPKPVRSTVALGGISRLAEVTELPAGSVAWPRRPDRFPGGRVLLYVATPALWPDGWRPPLPPEATLVAAAVGDPLPVATASPKRGFHRTRTLRWAVPPGSVYLLRLPEETAAATAASWHGRALAPSADWTSPSAGEPWRPPTDTPPLDTAGFGVVLTGVWT